MPELNLWLIRHGQSGLNAGIWSPKPTESQLTSLGREQAKKMAAAIITQPDLLIISPLIRAQETAKYILDRWPNTPVQTWPIEEFSYLSHERFIKLGPEAKKLAIKNYWQKNDPNYCDGDDVESFRSFLERVINFHTEIIKQRGFIVAVGHGQFFKAYEIGLTQDFNIDAKWMSSFREKETVNPMKNCEIFQLYFNEQLDKKS